VVHLTNVIQSKLSQVRIFCKSDMFTNFYWYKQSRHIHRKAFYKVKKCECLYINIEYTTYVLAEVCLHGNKHDEISYNKYSRKITCIYNFGLNDKLFVSINNYIKKR